MTIALLIARLLIAAVFATAGTSKIFDLRGSQQAVINFGAPAILSPLLALLIPLIELAVAVGLLLTATAWTASLAAAGLLAIFIAAIGINLARGRTPDCHCFGQLHSEPIGPAVLARNTLLLALTTFIGVAGRQSSGTSATNWIDALSGTQIAGGAITLMLLGLIIGEGSLLLNLLRQNGRLMLRIEALESAARPAPAPASKPSTPSPAGLPVGRPAPAFSLPGLYGETMTLDALRAPGKDVLLVFGSPGCGPCGALLPDIAAWQREHRDRLTVALVSTGTAESNRTKLASHTITHVLLQEQYEVAEKYKFRGTPSAVFVSATGVIVTELVAGTDAIQAMVDRRMGRQPVSAPVAAPPVQPAPPAPPTPPGAAMPAAPRPTALPRPRLQRGDAAPSFDLPDINGKQISLAGLRGRTFLLLFWNPGCGYCQRMLPNLKAWEQTKPSSAPEIVLFSSGPIEQVRALGVRSPVVHDPSGSVSTAYGASGTPMGILVDANGRIASELAGGADAVFALAGQTAPLQNLVVVQDHVARPLAGKSNGNGHRGVAIGDPAPPIRLPDLAGTLVDLASFRGRETLVLFWNTGCGFCTRMLPDLKAWEAASNPDDPRLLLVSSGREEDVRALGLRSTVLFDPGFSAGPAYGAHGTPMGVLVDAGGKIASDVAAGAESVFRLVGKQKV